MRENRKLKREAKNPENNKILKYVFILVILLCVFISGIAIGRLENKNINPLAEYKQLSNSNEEILNILEPNVTNTQDDININKKEDKNTDYFKEDAEEDTMKEDIEKEELQEDISENQENQKLAVERVDSKDTSKNSNKENVQEKFEEEKEEPILDNKKDLYVEWARIKDSSIEQYRLYIKDKSGKYINGTLEIKTIAGDTFEEKVTQNGSENIYIKSVIESVSIK